MRLTAAMLALALGWAVFESDLVPDWVWPELRPFAEGWRGLLEGVGVLGLRDRLRSGFQDWVTGDWDMTEPPSQPVQQEAEARPAFSEERPLRILVLGDSLAGHFLPNALSRLAQADRRVVVESLYRVAAGLSNPSRMDFAVELPRFWEQRARLAGRGFDLVVVLLGANDNQAIRHQGRWLRFASEAWRQEYVRRLDGLLAFLAEHSLRTYWLELPPMRDPNLERDVRSIEAVVRATISRHSGIEFVPQRHLLARDGAYTPVALWEGAQVTLRAPDGIHLSSHGARILARDLWERILRDFEFLPSPEPARPTDPPESPPRSGSPPGGSEASVPARR